MAFSEKISREHILEAIANIEAAGKIPAHRSSTTWDLVHNNKAYPPKYVLELAHKFLARGGKERRRFRSGVQTYNFLRSRRFTVVPKDNGDQPNPNRERRFWVVSPNVTNNDRTIDLWKNANKDYRAAFMGWGPDNPKHRLGAKFANDISKGDVILIARRFKGSPDVVGYGVVSTDESVKELKGFTAPDRKWLDGSIRKLSPFVFDSVTPTALPIMRALNHTQSLCQLHPSWNPEHRRVCDWLSKKLGLSIDKNGQRGKVSRLKATRKTVRRKPHTDPAQFDFSQRTAEMVRIAKNQEASLVRDYKKWLRGKGYEVGQLLYGRLICDAHEEERNNLIEAKSSNKREYIRMAVGQLLDYAFLGKKTFGTPHMAILLPRKPETEQLKWLDSLKINVIWKRRETFVDNAGGQFT